MADQFKKVVTRKLLKELDLKSKTGEPLKDAVLDIGHTGKLAESDKRSFDLLSQHIDLGGKLPMVIKPDKNGYPSVEFSGFDATKAQLLKDRIENDPKFFDAAVDELAANKNAPFVKMVDVDPEFRRPLVQEDVRLLSKQESSDPRKSWVPPDVDAWLQRTQQNGKVAEFGKNLLGSVMGRGYNEQFQNFMRSPNWNLPSLMGGGSKFSNKVSSGIATLSDNLISVPTLLTGAAGGGVVAAQYGTKSDEEAKNDIYKKNAVVSEQEKALRAGLDEGHLRDADWSDTESTQSYIKNSKYANRYLSEDAFGDVLKSNYGGKLRRLYDADASQVLQQFRKAYAERHKGLKDGQIPKYDDKGKVIKDKNGLPQYDKVDLQAFEGGIKTEGGVFLPMEDRPSEEMDKRGIPTWDGKNRYVAVLYVPDAESKKKIKKAKDESKSKEGEGKPVDKVKTRAEIAAEMDSGKADEEPSAQWVYLDVSKKGADAIYRDAKGNPAKPAFTKPASE